jgi:hypothetical protein
VLFRSIRLKTLSGENGIASRNHATAHRQYEMILGTFLSGKRIMIIATMAIDAVRLIFNIVKNNSSTAMTPLVHIYQANQLAGLLIG